MSWLRAAAVWLARLIGYSSRMRNTSGLKTPARRFLIYSVVLTISAIVIFGSAATSQKQSGVPPPVKQENASHEKLPDKEFTRPPEKPHDPTAFVFNFDQLDYYYRVPGEFTHRLNGDQYGFESLSFIITRDAPGWWSRTSCARHGRGACAA